MQRMALVSGRKLKSDEIELVWTDGSRQLVQTQGWAINGSALLMNLDGSKVVVSISSLRQFRSGGEWTRMP